MGFGGFEGFGPLSAGTCVVMGVSSTTGSVLVAIADDTALRVRAMVMRATALAWRTPLLRPLELPATRDALLPPTDLRKSLFHGTRWE